MVTQITYVITALEVTDRKESQIPTVEDREALSDVHIPLIPTEVTRDRPVRTDDEVTMCVLCDAEKDRDTTDDHEVHPQTGKQKDLPGVARQIHERPLARGY